MTNLQLRIGLLGVELDLNGEKVVGISAAAELHGAALVRGVYHRKLPQEGTTFLISVVSVALSYHRGIDTVSAFKIKYKKYI